MEADLPELLASLRRDVARRFQVAADAVGCVVAPYRICPLGAHVDHQLGQVTGMCLDRGVVLAFAPADGPQVRLASRDFPGEVSFSLRAVPAAVPGYWGNYACGAARALQERHALSRGIVGITAGRWSEGGLSSSAAIGVACVTTCTHAASGLAT